MLTDKVRTILDTGAEVCASADNSCLMHIGGALSRQRAGVRTMHLAEILAQTGSQRSPRLTSPEASAVSSSAGQDGAGPGDTQLLTTGHATDDPRQAAEVVAEVPDWEELREAGRAIKERVLRHLDDYLIELETAVQRAAAWCTGPATPRSATGSSRHHRPRRDRGRQGQVADHRGDQAHPARWPSVASTAWETDLAQLDRSSATTDRRTSWCRHPQEPRGDSRPLPAHARRRSRRPVG